MRFQVPQFIEVEDKIFGPLTLKQFLYLVGGGAAIFLLYVALPFLLFILFAIPVAILAVALAFYKINNKPLIKVMESAFTYFTSAKIYTWKKNEKKQKKMEKQIKSNVQISSIPAPTLTKNKLDDLAWSLDIKKEN
ncbi:PrgI family protein [Patescibacteria group bacterium]